MFEITSNRIPDVIAKLRTVIPAMAENAKESYKDHLGQTPYPPHSIPVKDDTLHYGTNVGRESLTSDGSTSVFGSVSANPDGSYILHWAGYPVPAHSLPGAEPRQQRPWITGGAHDAVEAMRERILIRLDD